MQELDKVCTACLSKESNLKGVGENNIGKLFKDIINEVQNSDCNVLMLICAKCEEFLRSWFLFKEKAKSSYLLLVKSQYSKETIFISKPKFEMHFTTESVQDNFKTECLTDSEQEDFKTESLTESVQLDGNTNLEKNDINKLEIIVKCDNYYDLVDEKPLKKHMKRNQKVNKKTNKTRNDPKISHQRKEPIVHSLNESESDINVLTFDEVMKERNEKKNNTSYQGKQFRCEDCLLAFLTEETLKKHLLSKHDGSIGSIMCDICKCRFTQQRHLERHRATHLQRYKCRKCGYRCDKIKTMTLHVKNHAEYVCGECGEKFSSLFRHKTHMAKEHQSSPHCKLCDKYFSTLRTYNAHKRLAFYTTIGLWTDVEINDKKTLHNTATSHQCPRCPRAYKWRTNLRRHLRNHKTADSGEKLACRECDKTFLTIITYKEHFKSSLKHLNKDGLSFSCDYCKVEFLRKTYLRDHINWAHLKKFHHKCEFCEKIFKNRASLRMHTTNVHKRINESLCFMCGRAYQTAAALRHHVIAKHSK